LYLVIWICNALDKFFFNRDFGLLFRFVNFVPKGLKIINFC